MTLYRLTLYKGGMQKSSILVSTKEYASKLERGAVGMGYKASVVPEEVKVGSGDCNEQAVRTTPDTDTLIQQGVPS